MLKMQKEEEADGTTLNLIVLFCFFHASFLFYWSAFPLNNTKWDEGFFSPSTVQYVSAMFNVSYWPVIFMTLNWALPFLLMWSLVNPMKVYPRIHFAFAGIFTVGNILILILLTVTWVFFCNGANGASFSDCRDYRWCGPYFGDNPLWCPNWVPFVPDVTYGDLSRNSEMTQHWAFAFVWVLFSLFHLYINRDARRDGILMA